MTDCKTVVESHSKVTAGRLCQTVIPNSRVKTSKQVKVNADPLSRTSQNLSRTWTGSRGQQMYGGCAVMDPEDQAFNATGQTADGADSTRLSVLDDNGFRSFLRFRSVQFGFPTTCGTRETAGLGSDWHYRTVHVPSHLSYLSHL